jgi:hypothetical protein
MAKIQNITQRSTSPLMRDLFGNGLEMILEVYNDCIIESIRKYPQFEDILNGCVNRTGFLLPYMFVEYGYYSKSREFMPRRLKELVISFGLIALAICIDDDAVDEFSDDLVKMVKAVSVSELLQNEAYSKLFERAGEKEAGIVLREIQNMLDIVTQYQHIDALNIVNFSKEGFNLIDYLEGTYKTGSPITVSLKLGMALAQDKEDEESMYYLEGIGRCFGTVLQLLDDLLDLEEDFKNYKGVVTLPMFAKINNHSFKKVFEIIDSNLVRSVELSSNFQYTEKITQVIGGFKIAKNKVMGRLAEPSKNMLYAEN